jgi:hypothetical protein
VDEVSSGGLLLTAFGVGSFDEFALVEGGSRSHEWHQVGALTQRQRCWADSMSLNAVTMPAAREPGPLVTRCRSRTVAKVDSIGLDFYGLQIILGKVRPFTSPDRGPSTGSDVARPPGRRTLGHRLLVS